VSQAATEQLISDTIVKMKCFIHVPHFASVHARMHDAKMHAHTGFFIYPPRLIGQTDKQGI